MYKVSVCRRRDCPSPPPSPSSPPAPPPAGQPAPSVSTPRPPVPPPRDILTSGPVLSVPAGTAQNPAPVGGYLPRCWCPHAHNINVFAEDEFAELLPEGWIMRNNIQFHIIWEGVKTPL